VSIETAKPKNVLKELKQWIHKKKDRKKER
jgi:hypothetical protein